MNLNNDIEFKEERLDIITSLNYDLNGIDIEKSKSDLINEIATSMCMNDHLDELNSQKHKKLRDDLQSEIPQCITECLTLKQLLRCKAAMNDNSLTDKEKDVVYWLISNYSSHE